MQNTIDLYLYSISDSIANEFAYNSQREAKNMLKVELISYTLKSNFIAKALYVFIVKAYKAMLLLDNLYIELSFLWFFKSSEHC